MSVTNFKKGLKGRIIWCRIGIFIFTLTASALTELMIVFFDSRFSNLSREWITAISLISVIVVSLVISAVNNKGKSIVVVATNIASPFGGLIISIVDYFFRETAEEFVDSIVAEWVCKELFNGVSPIVGGFIILAIMVVVFIVVVVLQRRELKLQDVHLLSYENYANNKEFEQKVERIKAIFCIISLIIMLVILFAWIGIVCSSLI